MKKCYFHGFFFPFPMIILGYALVFLSVFTIIHSVIYGLILFCIGAFLAFSTYGTEINEDNTKIREYVKYFLPKFGLWFDFSKFNYLSVKKKKSITRVYFSSNQSFTTNDEKYEVFLTDFILKNKILITEKKSFEDAQKFAQFISEITNIPFKSYFEIVSERKKSYK
jgi:hypothetical protein